MADDELELRMSVERPEKPQPQDMNGGLRVPAPRRRGEAKTGHTREAVVIGFIDRAWRQAGMQVDRHIKRFSSRQDRLEARIVEEETFGDAVDQGAAETEIAHRAFEFVGRGLRAIHRQMRKTPETIRMRRNRFRPHVIDVARERYA